jgi:hypothetical protein
MPNADPTLPLWFVLPLGTVALLLLAAHLLFLNADTEIDGRRRRIRMVNAVLMMLVVPFVVYGFGVATPSQSRAFIYVWVVTAALLLMVIMVALLDILHSWRLHREQLREVRRDIARRRDVEPAPSPAGPRSEPPAP